MRFRPETLRDDLLAVTERLRLPAGSDQRFQSMEGIQANRAAFIAAVHATWKELHRAAVDEIVRVEDALQNGPADPEFRSYLRIIRQLMRKISDAIVWTIVGERHVIKRVHKGRSRAFLKDSNLRDSLYILEEFNKLGEEIAIWTDACSCVDVGDFLYRGPKTGGRYSFLELKAGSVNDAIGDLLETKGGTEEKVAAIEKFAAKHGDKALKQFERTLKQSITDEQLLRIAKDDEGFDPVRKAHVRVWNPAVPNRSYDSELETWLAQSVQGADVMGCVDGCLHVLVSRDSRTYDERIAAFFARLGETCPSATRWAAANLGELTNNVATLDQSTFDPLSRPLFLRRFSPEHVADVLHGDLIQRVLLFFDWDAFAAVVAEAGGRLAWTTKRIGRRERARPGGPTLLIIGDRIPRIELANGFGMNLGGSEISRVLYDGARPSTVAQEYVNVLRIAESNPAALTAPEDLPLSDS
jgi:hypothetical protein